MGLMLTAVSPDIERSVLGVPGMNYSLLLSRSVDWETYEAILIPAYPDETDRRFILSFLQMLWDRGEGAGYAHDVDVPVLMHVVLGDHQVSELSASLRRGTHARPADPPAGHRPGPQPARPSPAGARRRWSTPFTGGGLVMWDRGPAPIPLTDTRRAGHGTHTRTPRSLDAQRRKAGLPLRRPVDRRLQRARRRSRPN